MNNPGDAYYKLFTTRKFSTGVISDADSLPVATANKNGVDDAGFVLTVSKIDTGRYLIAGSIPAGYANEDVVNISVAATVDGIADKGIVDTFLVETAPATTLPAAVPPSYLYTFTAGDIIRMALGEIRVLKPGETPAGEEMADCILRLNAMLETWAAEGLMVYVPTEEIRALVAGDKDITIGIGANWDTTRPLKISKNSFLRETATGIDYPLTILSRDEYNTIINKSTTNGRPQYMFYSEDYPNGVIYLYPPPASGYTLHLFSEKPFTSFSDEYTSFSFPTGYSDCMAYNLAIRLAGPYNKALSPSTLAIAATTKRNLEDMNAAKKPNRGTVNVPAGMPVSRGSINTLNRGWW